MNRKVRRERWWQYAERVTILYDRNRSSSLFRRGAYDKASQLFYASDELRDAYGWQDSKLDHDFYEVEPLPENDRIRYTISPTARNEVFRRLLSLNHERAKAEQISNAAVPPRKSKPRKRGTRTAVGLFSGTAKV